MARIRQEGFSEDEAVKFILRSSYNNNDAFTLSKAEIPTMADRADVFLKYMEYSGTGQRFTNGVMTPSQATAIIDSLRIIMSLNAASLTPKS